MRRIITLFTVLFLLIGMIPYTKADEVSINEIDATLMERGYPVEILELLDESERTRIFNESLHYADSFTITYTEESSSTGNIQPRGQISTSDLSLTFIISHLMDQNLELQKIDITYCYEWLNMPIFRWQDVISVSWDDAKLRLQDDTFSKVDKYSCWYQNLDYSIIWAYDEIHSFENGYANASPAGVSWYANLKENIGMTVTELYGYGSFTLVPAHGVTLYEGESLTFYGHYLHPTYSLSVSVNIADYGSFSPSVGSGYDERGSQRTITLSYR